MKNNIHANKKIFILYIFLVLFNFFTLLQPGQATASSDLCSATKPCTTDQYCDVTCKPKKTANEFCKSFFECISNQCIKNYCLDTTPKPATGTADAEKKPYTLTAPVLQINIPTIQPFTTAGIKKDESGNVELPFLGQYISGLYIWILSIAGLICAILIIIGGFTYVTSGGSADRITEAKEQITHALLGLGLLLLSYTILFLINPSLVKFENLKILVIEREDLPVIPWSDANANELPQGKNYCGCLNFRNLYSTSKLKDGAAITAKITALKSSSPLSAYGNIIAADAQKYNLDPALALAIWKVDSSLGTAGAGAKNKNPGNIICGGKNGTPGPTYTCGTSKLHFRIYNTWEDGIHDWFAKTDPNTGWSMWKNSKTVGQLINRYCPPPGCSPTDPNATAHYIDRVTNFLISNNNAASDSINNGACSCSASK